MTSRIVSSRAGVLGEWTVLFSTVRTDVPDVAVEAGDQIDFQVDCTENQTCDTFRWPIDSH